MPHIDEGILHAYLDGALEDVAAAGELPDAMTAADVVTHFELCADCRARLEAERSIREQAGMILRDVSVARVSIPDAVPVARRRIHRVVPLAWAASLFMAVTAGWFAGMQMRDRPEMVAEFAPMAAPEADAAARATAETASTEVRPDDAVQSAAQSEPNVAAVEPPRATPPPPAPPAPTEPRMEVAAEASKAVLPPAADMAAAGGVAPQRDAVTVTADNAVARQRIVSGFAAVDAEQQTFEALLDRMTPAGDSAIDWRAASSSNVAMLARGVFAVREAPVQSVEVAEDERVIVRVTQSLQSGVAVELIQWQSAEPDLAPPSLRLRERVATTPGIIGESTQSYRTAYVRTLADGRTEIVLTDTTDNTWVAIRAIIERDELSRIVQQRVTRQPIIVPPR